MIRLHEIGVAVKTRREEVGLSMQQLAAFSGMHAHALAALENGTLSDIGYNRLAALLQLDLLPNLVRERLGVCG